MERSDLPEGRQSKGLAEIIAAAIRAAVPDEEACVSDEDACFDAHPIHLMSSTGGEVDMVYARVEGAAGVIAEAVASVVARVRAEVAEQIASDLESRAATRTNPRYQATAYLLPEQAAAIAREHAGKGLPEVVGALPDHVGTRQEG